MTTLGGGLDTLHRRLTDIEEGIGEAVSGTAEAVSDGARGLMVSRTAEGNIGDIKQRSPSETKPENIMMKRRNSDPKNVGVSVGTPDSTEEEEKERKQIEGDTKEDEVKEVDMRPLDELDKEFQMGNLSVDEFIDMRKGMGQEESSRREELDQKAIDLRPLNELHKKYQRGEITTEEFIEIRKELKEGREDGY